MEYIKAEMEIYELEFVNTLTVSGDPDGDGNWGPLM